MWPIVTNAATKFIYVLCSVVLAGVFGTSSATPGATGVNGGAIYVPEFGTTGVISRSAKTPIIVAFEAFARANTGSTTIKYPSICFRNPLNALGKGSGSIVRLALYNGANPTAISGDVGLTKGCGNSFGSGSVVLINDLATASGSRAYYTTGTQTIGSDDYIKFTPSGVLAPGFTARLTGIIEDDPLE